MLWARSNRAFGSSSASIAASAAGWIGSAGWPTTSAGAVMRRRCADDGRDPAEEQPVHVGRHGVGPLVERVERDARPERHDAAGHRPRDRRSALTVNGANRAANISGPKASIPASSALSSTGISTSRPAHPLGRLHRELERDVRAERGAAHHRLLRAEVVEQRHHLLGEGGHRVPQRVGRPVGAAVAEQVEGDDVQTLGRERPRQRLVHPARHQLSGQQHHPGVAGAVLGVLEPVPAGAVVEEELPDALGDQRAPRVTRLTGAG